MYKITDVLKSIKIPKYKNIQYMKSKMIVVFTYHIVEAACVWHNYKQGTKSEGRGERYTVVCVMWQRIVTGSHEFQQGIMISN